MPLNSAKLHPSVISIMREVPMDRESSPDFSYQTKVEIYDRKCSGCQFARIEVCTSNGYNEKFTKVFDNIDDALNYARRNNCKINRLCQYPADIIYRGSKPIYPNVTEIISNTCEFWNEPEQENENIPEWLISETLNLLENATT